MIRYYSTEAEKKKQMTEVNEEIVRGKDRSLKEEEIENASKQFSFRYLRTYTKEQWLTLAGLCYVGFASNTSFSLISPFLTAEVGVW